MFKKFISDEKSLEKLDSSRKWKPCPHCQRRGNIALHGFLKGCGDDSNDGEVKRGRRYYCSARGSAEGCNRTFSVLFADYIPHFMFSTILVWKYLQELNPSVNCHQAWLSIQCKISISTAYRWKRRFQKLLPWARQNLCAQQPYPESSSMHPIVQTLMHFKNVFPDSLCEFKNYQLAFNCSVFPI